MFEYPTQRQEEVVLRPCYPCIPLALLVLFRDPGATSTGKGRGCLYQGFPTLATERAGRLILPHPEGWHRGVRPPPTHLGVLMACWGPGLFETMEYERSESRPLLEQVLWRCSVQTTEIPAGERDITQPPWVLVNF